MTFLRYFSILLFLAGMPTSGHAADRDTTGLKKHRLASACAAIYQTGNVLNTNPFVAGKNARREPIDRFRAWSVQFTFETNGRKLWQQIYHYPSFGMGLYVFDFFNNAELGKPGALYGFFDAPFVRYRKWSINYHLGLGLAFNWKPYNHETNPFNYAIGSKTTSFIEAGIGLKFQLGEHFDLTAGINLNHFSNGAQKVPNLGINTLSARISLKYIFSERPDLIEQPEPEYEDNWEFLWLFGYSQKQVAYDTLWTDTLIWFTPEDYNIYYFAAGINRQVGHKLKIGIGMDISYNEAHNAFITHYNSKIERQNSKGTKVAIGFYPSFEWVIDRFSIILQPGWYFFRSEYTLPEPDRYFQVVVPKRLPGLFYQRIGFKFHVLENMFIGLNVRAYDFRIADYLEWNIGYRLQK